jgi:glutamate-ammonia-ligase adenylyltransferase
VELSLRRILTAARDPVKLRTDVLDMRERMAQQHRGDSIWDFKHRRGGLVDIDFIAQYLMLRHAHDHPDVLRRNPSVALKRLAETSLIDRATAERLIDAVHLWRQLQQMTRLLVGEKVDEAKLRAPTERHLAKVADCPDFACLKGLIQDRLEAVHQDFRAVFGIPSEK